MKKLLLIWILLFQTSVFGSFFELTSYFEKIPNVVNQQEPTISAIMASPNPFNIKTTIFFISTKDQEITFTVKNLLGKTIFSDKLVVQKGENQFDFYKNDLNPGMYLYSFQTTKETISKRLVIK